jgi:hypothetical protein
MLRSPILAPPSTPHMRGVRSKRQRVCTGAQYRPNDFAGTCLGDHLANQLTSHRKIA